MTAPVLEDQLDVQLCVGLIRHLADLELCAWSPTGVYPAAAAGAFLVTVPNLPDRALTLSPYQVLDDPDQAMSTIGVQVRTRWAGADPRATLNYAGAIFDALHGLGPVVLPGGVSISQCLRRSSTPMGQDGSKRWSWADNYYVDVDRPSSNRS